MADLKITQLTAVDAPIITDIFPMVDDPGGTPVTKKSTFQQLADLYAALTQTLTNKTIDGDTNTLQDIPYSAIKGAAWTSFTPTWSYVTPGSGSTSVGRYIQIGKLVYFHAKLILGTSPTMGALTLNAPVTVSSDYQEYTPLGFATFNDAGLLYSGRWYNTVGYLSAETVSGTKIAHSTISSTNPFTWAAGDWVTVSASYFAA